MCLYVNSQKEPNFFTYLSIYYVNIYVGCVK